MRTMNLMGELEFHERDPYAQPLYVDQYGRAIRFMLKPGQTIHEHKAQSSPFYVVVLKGQGVFTGGDGREERVGPNALLVFEPGEAHSVRALDEEFVFIGFLHGVPGTRPDHVGGELGQP
jgi:quercetin dioxygenase-like cupin family protein